MTDGIGGIGEGLDIGWQPREDVNKVTEEAVRRIQEQSQQAKQIQQEIKQDKAINNKLAEFLAFLVNNLNNEHLIKLLYELFFKTKHPKTGVTYLRKKINTIVVVWLFYPFYTTESKQFWIDIFFDSLLEGHHPITVTSYIGYIKKLSAKYHDNIALDPDILFSFLIEIIHHFWLLDVKSLSEEKYEEFANHLKHELYK